MYKIIRGVVEALTIIGVIIFGLLLLQLFFNKVANSAEVAITASVTMACAIGDYETMEKFFYNTHKESVILSGVTADNKNMVYVFRNKNTDVWSIVVLTTKDVYCLAFHGEGLTPRVKRSIHEQSY